MTRPTLPSNEDHLADASLSVARAPRRMTRRDIIALASLGLSALPLGALITACGANATPAASGASATTAPSGAVAPAGKLTIAYQPGIGYAQIILAKQGKWLEELLPKMEISYKVLSSGAAIRDGMIAGDIQVGSGGSGPFLVGWDAGVGWKLLSALNDMDLWLMVKDPRIKGLKDLTPADKVATPTPDSIQAVTLRKAALKDLGNAKALDTNIVTMAHPDGLQALISGQIAGHLTSPPFQFQEQDAGARRILGSYDLFGPNSFVGMYVIEKYYNANPAVMDALYQSIRRGTDLIKTDPDKAAQVLGADAGGSATADQYKKWMAAPGITYTTIPHAYVPVAQFMKDINLIKKAPTTWQDLVFDNLKKEQGS